MNGLAEARLRVCRTCEHRRTAYAGVWQWPHCVYVGEDMEVSPALLERDAARCPLEKWWGLQPIDLEAERAAKAEKALEVHREFVKPYLDAALCRIQDPALKAAFLVDLVYRGRLMRQVAEERAQAEGLPLD